MKKNRKKLTLHRSLRRLAAVLVTVGAPLAFAAQATPAHAQTGCEPTADVPGYISFGQRASAHGYVRCGGYYEIRLKTSSGSTLATRSGYYTSPLTVTTNWTYCPSGTSVYTHLYEKANVQGRTYTFTATSALFLCP